MRIRAALFAVLVAATPACAQKNGDPTIPFSNDDPAMNAAISQAQETLPLFLRLCLGPKGALEPDASVKVDIPIPNSANSEAIWVEQLSHSGNQFNGLFANQPQAISGALGAPVRFTRDQILDWSCPAANDDLWGNFTTRVLVTRLPDAMANAVLDQLTPEPLPPHW